MWNTLEKLTEQVRMNRCLFSDSWLRFVVVVDGCCALLMATGEYRRGLPPQHR